MVEKKEKKLSLVQQCDLLSIYRSGIYYHPVSESDLDLEIMNEIDKCYTDCPFYGTRRMAEYLKGEGFMVGRKGVRSYYVKMGIWAIYPKKTPNTSEPNKKHKIYPYLLRNLKIIHNNQVWATDITYIPMKKGFMYLCAIIDLHSKPSEFITLFVGPQYSFLLKQRDVFITSITSSEQEQEFENDNIHRNIFGMVTGFDINLQHFVIGGRVGLDFVSNKGDGTSNTPRYKNVSTQLTFGYKFY